MRAEIKTLLVRTSKLHMHFGLAFAYLSLKQEVEKWLPCLVLICSNQLYSDKRIIGVEKSRQLARL